MIAWNTTETLPPEGTCCAVLLRDGSMLTAWPTYWHGASNDFNHWSFPHPEDDDSTDEVTHWIALPPDPTRQGEKQC